MRPDVLTTVLPNGFSVQHVSASDLPFLYEETFQSNAYLQHGVQLQPGGTVLDIGSNVGFFSMAAAQAVGPEGLVVSVEPLPQLQAAQTHNLRSHRTWCQQQGVTPAPVRLLPMGVGDGSTDSADFTLYTAAAGWSSMKPDDAEVEANMGVFLCKALRCGGGGGVGTGWAAWAGRLLARLAPAWLFDWLTSAYVRHMLGAKQVVRCELTTVSDIMRAQKLGHVDLLKIDVERAELDVLHGVAAADWPNIQQVAMEAHSGGGQLEEVLRVLRADAGFESCAVEQTAMLEGSTLWNVFCTRATEHSVAEEVGL